MLRNSFKTAIRSLLKNKAFTFLNVFGLTLGIATWLLIVMYVNDELSYDRFNTNANRIFRVNTDTKFGMATSSRAIASSAVAPTLIKEFPEIDKAVRFLPDQELIKKGNELISEDKGAFVDPGVFDVFTLPMIEGDPKKALTEPHCVVITESMAKKYFDKTEVVGRIFSFFEDSALHKITGVIKDIPKTSHFRFDFFLSMADVKESNNTRLNVIQPYSTYILLKPGSDYKKLEEKFPSLLRKNLDFYDAMVANGDYFRINLTPLIAIHLESNRSDELDRNGDIRYVRIFSIIAIFTLLIACINFMNLSTARSSNRFREVGIRKILGSGRKYLIVQFLSESYVIAIISTFFAVMTAWVFLPLFNQLSGKMIKMNSEMLTWLSPYLFLMIMIVGLLAGSYPSFILSSVRSIDVLKSKLLIRFKNVLLRSSLVVFQFSVSISLIIGTLVIYRQLQYIYSKDLGFNRNQVIVVKNMNSLKGNQAKILKQEVKRLPGVLNASISSFLPTNRTRWLNYFHNQASNLQSQYWRVDADYLNTLGMKLAKGRNFSNDLPTDSSAVIINETAANLLGISKNIIKQKIYQASSGKEFQIIGVVKDFNFSSLRENVTPVVMALVFPEQKKGDDGDNLTIRVSNIQLPDLLNQVGNKWIALAPPEQFSFSFMDEDFDAIYTDEQRMGEIFIAFAILAIVIGCLGLFGLAANAAEQRTKEISIRKVLGASIKSILGLLSTDFLRLVLIAILISFPIAWYLMHEWLEDFAYRVEISWWLMGVAGIAAILIALTTISYITIKAANANPIKSLRSE